jgi:hypothetical protein
MTNQVNSLCHQITFCYQVDLFLFGKCRLMFNVLEELLKVLRFAI